MNPEAPSPRPARPCDLPAIVALHEAAFPGYFMTLLGPGFLTLYYRLVLDEPGSILLVEEAEGAILGFVCGLVHPAPFYRKLKAMRGRLLLAVLGRLLRQPTLLGRLVASYRQADRNAQTPEADGCELTSLATHPAAMGRGIGRALVQGFIRAASARAERVLLTTDADDNEAVNRFYRNLGFRVRRTFERSKGRMMNEYSYDLEPEED